MPLGITFVNLRVDFAVGTTAGTTTSGEPDPEIVEVSISDYLLVEVGTGPDPREDEWAAGQLRRIMIEVTPQETGYFGIYLRSTRADRDSDSDTFS